MAALLALLAALIVAAPTPPAPSRWVTDTAGFLSPATRSALDAKLESYEHATGHQVVVWIGTSIGGADLADWAVRTFADWKIGRKGADDGIAMFVLSEDRMVDIEVGYGLEDKVPDAIASRIIREQMTPKLKAGDRDGAITAGVDGVLAAIEGQPWTGSGSGATALAPPPVQQPPTPWTTYLVYGVLGVIAVLFLMRHPSMALWILSGVFSGRGGRGGFGGGGGGFSGGGGSSGGGGARGGW